MGRYDFDVAKRVIENWKREHRRKSRRWLLNRLGVMQLERIKTDAIKEDQMDFLRKKLDGALSALKIISEERDALSERFWPLRDLLCGLEDGEEKEVVGAYREDRSIIPPVRIGETIYHITTCKNFPQVLDGTMYDSDGGPGTATGYYCPCELQENCPYSLDDDGGFDCDKHKNQLAVFTDTVESIFVSQNEEVMNFDYSGSADFSEFERTVFKDYDKAKAALEEIKNGKND